MQTSLNDSEDMDADICHICGEYPVCGGLGMVRGNAPVGHPNFGKMFRCPNNPAEIDGSWLEKLRQVGNLGAFADKTFGNYTIDLNSHTAVERDSLAQAVDAAKNFAYASQQPNGWLLLEGSYGVGKTHLAAAVGNERLQRGDAVLFITAPDLLDHLRSTYGPNSEVSYDEMFERVRNAPILVLDDLGVENPSQWAQEKLYQLFNHRYSLRLPTIITTNVDVDNLDPRIRSRLLDVDLVRRVVIKAPDFRSLVQNELTQIQSDLNHYREMTFESFNARTKVTPEERENLKRVWGAAKNFAENPTGWFLLLGGYGTGKTHLAAAIAHHWRDRGQEVMFISTPDLLDYLRTGFDTKETKSFNQRLYDVKTIPHLILDNLGTENATSWAKEKMFQILDYRYVAHIPTVIATSKNIEEIDERLRTRLLDRRICVPFEITARAYSIRNNDKSTWQR